MNDPRMKEYFARQSASAYQLPGMAAAGAAPAAAAAAPGIGAAAAGASALGAAVGGTPGAVIGGAGGGASLGALMGIGGPAGAGIGAGLALIGGLLSNAARRKKERHMAESNKEKEKGSILSNASDSRSLTLRSLM